MKNMDQETFEKLADDIFKKRMRGISVKTIYKTSLSEYKYAYKKQAIQAETYLKSKNDIMKMPASEMTERKNYRQRIKSNKAAARKRMQTELYDELADRTRNQFMSELEAYRYQYHNS